MRDAYMKTLSLLCLVLSLSVLGSACNKPGGANSPRAEKSGASEQRTPEVTVVHPEPKSLRRVIDQPASVEAFEETPLLARITGYVQKVHVDIGDRVQGPRLDGTGKQVEAGQVLAELWVPEMEEELRQKRALVVQAEAELKLTREAVAVADADRNRLKSQYERLTKIGNSGVIDKEIVEETRNGYEVSSAKLAMAQADVGVKQARVEVAKAEEGRLSALLEYSKIRAPYDGVITSRTVHTGHYLAATGTRPLFVIARRDKVRVLVDVPEADAGYVNDGTPARIRLQFLRGQEFEGKVTRSSWSLDSKARTLRAEIHLPNPKGELRPGMYAYVTFTAQLEKTFTLPAASIFMNGDQLCCVRIEKDKALRTPLKIGVRQGETVQVLKKQAGQEWQDLTGDEDIVTSNPGSLSDGQAVVIKKRS
jgi:RND family efflux transporter MFP subunit